MVDRRTFTTLLAGTIAAPTLAFGKTMTSRNVFYSAVGPQLTPYGVDVDKAELTKRDPVSTAANIQYAWPHPSKRWLYVVSSSGGPAAGDATGSVHVANAFTIDPATGALKPHGETVKLATRPIHASVDHSGHFLLIAYNNPSSLTVHRINADGTIGDKVQQPNKLDTGIFAHQIRLAPDNKHVILVTRGNNAPSDNPVDPGSIKVFTFKDGVLANLSAIAPGDGMHFGPRHLDFHPKKPWVFVSIESQNQLMVYKLDDKTGLSRDPLFTKNTLADPNSKLRQAAGAIHVSPDGRFVYVANRAWWTSDFEGKKVFTGGENSLAVFAINQTTGEPTLIQNADGHGNYLRTFNIDPSRKLLVAAPLWSIAVREGNSVTTMPAGLVLYRVGGDGKLTFARKYDIDATEQKQQFWAGMVTLA
ncbi:lactonase family protein [Bradyrhizobium erythrophlei]|uniref:6-phosphogluconolactonase, cycloisomerase 2 family n=1 Tax=Bradyrhizobium erythrophlei TaxID=1437360 RepID=A0A1M7UGU8_9BRAD|nr:beta-propeller fold lactonase family protein [Bradyrhizobium erythrophlei]SHN82125.1 6-phosphogluconolactonase, cycloisomerase 2 family [Bradyrhizobium erythrophlei]